MLGNRLVGDTAVKLRLLFAPNTAYNLSIRFIVDSPTSCLGIARLPLVIWYISRQGYGSDQVPGHPQVWITIVPKPSTAAVNPSTL